MGQETHIGAAIFDLGQATVAAPKSVQFKPFRKSWPVKMDLEGDKRLRAIHEPALQNPVQRAAFTIGGDGSPGADFSATPFGSRFNPETFMEIAAHVSYRGRFPH